MSAFGLRADNELQIKLAANASHIVRRNADERLFREGDKSDGVYLVKSGALSVSLEASPGKTIVRRILTSGYVVGLPSAIHGNCYTLTCDVVEDAELAYISRKNLTGLIQSDTDAAMKLLDLLSSEVQALTTALAQPMRPGRRGSRTAGNYQLN